MYKGTTPTFTLELEGDNVDLTQASNVYVTFATSKKIILTKEDEDLTVEPTVVKVFLTQKETLQFPSQVMVQINWTYDEGGETKRACSEIAQVAVNRNLLEQVLE